MNRHYLASTRLTRRRLVASGLAASTVAMAGCAAVPADTPPTAALDPLTTYVRLRGSTEPRLCFGWLSARRSAIIDGEVYPMMGVQAATVSRFSVRDDQSWDLVVREITVYTEVETGELMEEMTMPVSGARVRPPVLFLSPEDYVIRRYHSEAGELAWRTPGDEALGAKMAPRGTYVFDQRVHEPTGDAAWVSSRSDYHYRLKPTDPKARRMFYKEGLTFRGARAELADSSVSSVAATLAYSSSSGFRPWMEMGEIDGHDLTDGYGGKVDRVEDLPARYLAQVEQVYPGVFDDPAKLLERPA